MNTTKTLFNTGLCWHTGLLFLIVGSEDPKENFYDLIVYLPGIKAKLNVNDFNLSIEINDEDDLMGEMTQFLDNDPFVYFHRLVNTLIAYDLSISNVKPEENLIGDILLDIENWLKELYVFEHQKSFSIPFTAAISTFKTSMEMLMNFNPNVQAKVLSLEEMEKMNHTCVAKICSLFHKNIAGIKAIVDSSLSKSQIANETDVVIASVHYAIVAFKEKDGLGYSKLAGEMCDSIYSFYDNCYTDFEVNYDQGPHDEYSFNEGKSLSKNPCETFTYHISKKLPTSFLKFDDVHKQEMKALKDELTLKIEGSKNLSTAKEYYQILNP